MRGYLIRRVILIVPTLFLVTIIVFGVMRMIPGDVIDLMVAEMASESGMGAELDPEYIREMLGLDVPLHVQYGGWVANMFQGDLGNSLWTQRAVTEDLINRIPVSFELGIIALIVGVLVALPIGVYSAIRQDTIGDYVGRSIAIMALSLPNFWVATMLIVFPSIWWNWSPPVQYIAFIDDPMGNLGQFIFPALIMGMNMSGGTMRMTRTMMLEVLRQDYIRTAWAKGLKERIVVVRHALKNALIPVVTQVGMRLPVMIGGAVILEQIFCLPGVGNLLVQAITERDYPVISGVNLTLATFILFANLVVDLTYSYLDPRIFYK
jgi:peptide/nickel transport system permease protein